MTDRAVIRMALRIALVVGTLLVLINHGPNILNGTLTTTNYWQMALTYLVPYSVSTYSSVSTLLHRKNTD